MRSLAATILQCLWARLVGARRGANEIDQRMQEGPFTSDHHLIILRAAAHGCKLRANGTCMILALACRLKHVVSGSDAQTRTDQLDLFAGRNVGV